MDDKKENYIEPTEVKPEANVTITPAEGMPLISGMTQRK